MSLAYFPLYADDFEADTAHLTLEEDGAYNRLLRLCWRTPGCSLPDDRQWIYRKMRARTDEEKGVVDIVLDEFFTTENGRVSNARLMKEWLAANEAHERRKKAGAKGGKSKSLKNNKTGPSNAVAKPKQPEPEPEIKEKDTKKKKSRLPDGWQIPPDWVDWAKSQGMDPATISREAAQFADHHRAKGSLMLDWRRAWQTWVRNSLKWSQPKNGNSGSYTIGHRVRRKDGVVVEWEGESRGFVEVHE